MKRKGPIMNAWKFTVAETKVINHAFYACQRLEQDATAHTNRLEQAAKFERKERSSMTVARALVVQSFYLGLMNDPTASTLAGMSAGCRDAVIVGAECRKIDAHTVRNQYGIGTYAAAASEAHRAYIQRGLDAVNKG